jgi:transcription elongation factor GreA
MKAGLIKRFETEIAALERELTQELPKEIQRAREHGDLRENAEYHAAKERQRFVEARVSMLKKRVSEIQLMNMDRIPKDRAGFGSKLTIVENGATSTYELVMPEDSDPDRGLISVASPIGKAFVGKEEGDEVRVPTPAGVRRFEIVKLSTIHDEG